jgi:3-hydroxyacyl-[acyl-carrier-protein] dehydratase
MPGVFIMEALMQVSQILTLASESRWGSPHRTMYLLGIDKGRFRKPVLPGDQLILTHFIGARGLGPHHGWRKALKAPNQDHDI